MTNRDFQVFSKEVRVSKSNEEKIYLEVKPYSLFGERMYPHAKTERGQRHIDYEFSKTFIEVKSLVYLKESAFPISSFYPPPVKYIYKGMVFKPEMIFFKTK
ncbi:DNA/RNA nuclease SfsA [Thermodesulfovibrio sp.]|uniref:DNA/RNA nuclease SfsA n=1 Tax=Thermodesulfovibrio sp. TaxID=2067987 RepID=UPI003C7DE74A